LEHAVDRRCTTAQRPADPKNRLACLVLTPNGGRTFQAQIEPALHINGDRELLTQPFANLPDNALRHSPRAH